MVIGLAAALILLPNDANFVAFGGAGTLAPHKTVHMLGEDINITLFDDKVHVRAYFSFENRGPATSVQMAFPFEQVDYGEPAVKRFATKVDGSPATTRVVPVKRMNTEDQEWLENVKTYAYVKSVTFAKGQRRTVLVDYITTHGYAGSGWQIDSYILKSGATWAGKIGVATITVDWTPATEISRPDLEFVRGNGTKREASWYFVTRKRATTTLRNFEPDFDLDLTTVQGWWDVWVNGIRLDSGRAISDSNGPALCGNPRDPLYYYQGLGDLLEEWATKKGFKPQGGWVYPQVVKAELHPDRLVLYNGKVLRLKRGLRKADGSRMPGNESLGYVHLKDLIEAIGGQFRWNSKLERIEITLAGMPKR